MDGELVELPTLARAPHGIAFIALDEGAVAGAVTIRLYPWKEADAMRLFVRPGHRRRGIATALLAQAVASARERHLLAIRAIAMAGMSEGIAALHAAGFSTAEPFAEVPAAWQPVVYLRMRFTDAS